MKVDKYVDQLFKKIPRSEQKKNIVKDVKLYLKDKVLDLMAQGKTEEDAIHEAIEEFGDIEDLRRELDIKDRKKVDKAFFQLIFSILGSLLIIGLATFINLYYTPHVIWLVYPTFVVLWWPLALFYRWLSIK